MEELRKSVALFDEQRDVWGKRAAEGIEANRKGDMRITVRDAKVYYKSKYYHSHEGSTLEATNLHHLLLTHSFVRIVTRPPPYGIRVVVVDYRHGRYGLIFSTINTSRAMIARQPMMISALSIFERGFSTYCVTGYGCGMVSCVARYSVS